METQPPEPAAALPSNVAQSGTPPERSTAAVTPQAVVPTTCSSCAAAQAGPQQVASPPPCVYVIGHIEPRFPQLSLEKEARQATARAGAYPVRWIACAFLVVQVGWIVFLSQNAAALVR